MKLFLSIVVCLLSISLTIARADNYKDIRITYLWDVTLSMKGYNGSPNIYDKVVNAMIKDIESISNDRTEVVVIPFQDTEYCCVWKENATQDGIQRLKRLIHTYKNTNVTNTNIAAPLGYAVNEIFSTDKIDILKLMTDGKDNVNPEKLDEILNDWCKVAKSKDVYGFYILLTDAALGDEDIVMKLKGTCNFEAIDVREDVSEMNNIRQINVDERLVINVRDDYNQPKILRFSSHGGDIKPGFKIHFKTLDNPYLEIDEDVILESDCTVELHPRFKLSKSGMMSQEWIKYNDVVLEMTQLSVEGNHKSTRLLDNSTTIQLINKPEKTVSIYVQ